MAASDDEKSSLSSVVSAINAQFGDDVKLLNQSRKLLNKVSKRKQVLEAKLGLVRNSSSERLEISTVGDSLSKAETAVSNVCTLNSSQESVLQSINSHIDNAQPVLGDMGKKLELMDALERYYQYFEWILKVDECNEAIQSALLIKADDRAATSFAQLANFSKVLQGSSCKNLVCFVNETVLLWYGILLDKFGVQFEELLSALNWPTLKVTEMTGNQKSSARLSQADVDQKLVLLFTYLLQVELPQVLIIDEAVISTVYPTWRPLCLPMQLLVKPLVKRFRYHFCGKKLTNNIAKPEWYMTQALTWIKDNSNFIQQRIQPVFDKNGLKSVEATTDFMRGVVQLVVEKLISDFSKLEDDTTFFHTIDEALLFDKELRRLDYPSNQVRCSHILCDKDIFARWLRLEDQVASRKMDAMLDASSAWNLHYGGVNDVDDTKIPECTEAFMTLMTVITERYKYLPSPLHTLQFLDLQLDLLSEFHQRLVQVKRPLHHLDSNYCKILNTVNYIIAILTEWCDLAEFIWLQHYKENYEGFHDSSLPLLSEDEEDPVVEETDGAAFSSARSSSLSSVKKLSLGQVIGDVDPSKLGYVEGAVFDNIVKLYAHVRNEMIENVLKTVMFDVKARNKPYRNDLWRTMPPPTEYLKMTISDSACGLLLVIKDRLHLLEEQLCHLVFLEVWQRFAELLNKYIFEEVICNNNFNDGGAAQFQYDMNRGLYPLFGEYTQRPENYFKDIKEGCLLLTLKTGSALLLKDVLHNALHRSSLDNTAIVDPVAVLHELGIFKFTPDQAELVLYRRLDLS